MAVLLIGSTGNGKSTLGNFLVNPADSLKPGGRYFKVATDNFPQTQHTQYQSTTVKIRKDEAPREFTVIDTPGLNENKERDLSHMIDLIETLQKVRMIQACIFVVKFCSKIDQQYRNTIEYYAKLLPSLFESNIVVVVTDYATDERSEAMRRRQGINYEVITNNIRKEIEKTSHISFTPILFSIDCLPWDDDEMQNSKSVRDAILSYIFSLKAVNVQNLQVAKTKALVDDDEKCIKEYEGQITGYNARLQQANEQAKEALDKTQREEKGITDISSELIQLRENLREKDSDDTVVVGTWSVDDSWKFFQWQRKEFTVSSQYDFTNVSQWTNGYCEIKDLEVKKYEVRGAVHGQFMRGLYASISLETLKRLKYEKEIISLKAVIEEKEKAHQQAMEHAAEHRKFFEQFKEEIDLLHKFISDKREKIKEHATTTLSLEQAHQRLEKLR